jgi:hypothetical protein
MTTVTLAPTAPPIADSRAGSRAARWGGRVLSGTVIAFCLLDSAMKIPPLQPVTDTMAALGWPSDPATARSLAALLIGAALLYAYRPTAIFGAVLMTGYLGGAVATHARIGSPLLSHALFGVYVGILAWGGLWLREPRLRALLPFARRR